MKTEENRTDGQVAEALADSPEGAGGGAAAAESASGVRRAIYGMSGVRRRTAETLRKLGAGQLKGTVWVMTGDDAMDADLREGWGEGTSAVTGVYGEAAEGLARESGAGEVRRVELPLLPAETGSLGGAVLAEALEYAEDPVKLMAELHRALAPKSKAVLHVRRRRKSLVGALRRLSGLTDPTREVRRAGYTPSELFEVVKEGFDVEESVGYGRFFTEAAEWLAELFAGMMPQTTEEGSLELDKLKRARRVYRAMRWLFGLSRALDAVCFFLPTHHWAVRLKRRLLWAPRIAPRMRDGRPLAEAVLSGKIGTAVGQ